jgi:hypothetical protein
MQENPEIAAVYLTDAADLIFFFLFDKDEA